MYVYIKMARQPLNIWCFQLHAVVNGGLDLKQSISQVNNYGGTCILDVSICEWIVGTIIECTKLYYTFATFQPRGTFFRHTVLDTLYKQAMHAHTVAA